MKSEKILEALNKCRVILGMDEIKPEVSETPEVKADVKLEILEAKLSDGTLCYSDFNVGSPLFKDPDQKEVFEDGEYELEDGKKIIIKDGVIGEIIEVPAAPEPDITEDLKKENEALKKELEDLKSKFTEMASDVEKYKLNEKKLKLEIEKIGSEPSVEPITTSIQEKRELTGEEEFLNSLKAMKAALKNKI